MKKIFMLLAATIFSTSAFAQVIATGADANKIYDSLTVKERRLTDESESTLVKVVNFTSNGYSIQKGEKGMICDKYVSQKIVHSMGTNYLCHLVDLTAVK